MWTSSCSAVCATDVFGDRAGVARDGGAVAGRHAIAQRQRLDERGEDADLQRGELCRARFELFGSILGEQQLPRQDLEEEEGDDHRDQRRRPTVW